MKSNEQRRQFHRFLDACHRAEQEIRFISCPDSHRGELGVIYQLNYHYRVDDWPKKPHEFGHGVTDFDTYEGVEEVMNKMRALVVLREHGYDPKCPKTIAMLNQLDDTANWNWRQWAFNFVYNQAAGL